MRILKTKNDWKGLNEAAWAASVYGEWERVNSLSQLLNCTPVFYGYENVDGYAEYGVAVYINGKKQLEEKYEYGHANNHTPTDFEDAPTIVEQIAGKDVKFLSIVVWVDDSYNKEKWEREFIIELQPLDIKKIRRRVEDTLRKTTDANLIVRLANELNVKLI